MLPAMKKTKYKVNEIFYSVQAEGTNAGRAAIFVRFSGCNLACRFCDTNHAKYREMTKEQIEDVGNRLDKTGDAMVVFTGGEPTLQLTDKEPMFKGRFRAIETNGILEPPRWVEWVTVSPKTKIPPREMVIRADEIKFVLGSVSNDYLKQVEEMACRVEVPLFIQPMADKEGRFCAREAIRFVKRNPMWCLSLQFHKLLNIR